MLCFLRWYASARCEMVWGHAILGMRFIHMHKTVQYSTSNLIRCSGYFCDLLVLFGGRWFYASLYVWLGGLRYNTRHQFHLVVWSSVIWVYLVGDGLRPSYSWYPIISETTKYPKSICKSHAYVTKLMRGCKEWFADFVTTNSLKQTTVLINDETNRKVRS